LNVRGSVSGIAAFALTSLLLIALLSIALLSTVAPGFAQEAPPSAPSQVSPAPAPGFVPPYEIMRTVRAAGFDPLAPPLREGTTYVLRATDFRGILMRVVVDARSGAIRDANRIVPGPGSDAQLGMMSPYESVPDYVPQPYGPPPQFDLPKPATSVPSLPPSSRPPTARNATHTPGASGPPLPRPRPATLAARKSTADVERVDPTPPNPTPPNSVAPAPSAAAAIAAPSKTPPVVPPLND